MFKITYFIKYLKILKNFNIIKNTFMINNNIFPWTRSFPDIYLIPDDPEQSGGLRMIDIFVVRGQSAETPGADRWCQCR
jgi:hypothetical protein